VKCSVCGKKVHGIPLRISVEEGRYETRNGSVFITHHGVRDVATEPLCKAHTPADALATVQNP
jgi:hypothetical protein